MSAARDFKALLGAGQISPTAVESLFFLLESAKLCDGSLAHLILIQYSPKLPVPRILCLRYSIRVGFSPLAQTFAMRRGTLVGSIDSGYSVSSLPDTGKSAANMEDWETEQHLGC